MVMAAYKLSPLESEKSLRDETKKLAFLEKVTVFEKVDLVTPEEVMVLEKLLVITEKLISPEELNYMYVLYTEILCKQGIYKYWYTTFL